MTHPTDPGPCETRTTLHPSEIASRALHQFDALPTKMVNIDGAEWVMVSRSDVLNLLVWLRADLALLASSPAPGAETVETVRERLVRLSRDIAQVASLVRQDFGKGPVDERRQQVEMLRIWVNRIDLIQAALASSQTETGSHPSPTQEPT